MEQSDNRPVILTARELLSEMKSRMKALASFRAKEAMEEVVNQLGASQGDDPQDEDLSPDSAESSMND